MQYISLIISLTSLAISIISFILNNKRASYTLIDDNYKSLLGTAINNPKFRDPEITKNYKDFEKKDNAFYYSYCSYAFQIWNFVETLYDFNNTNKEKKQIIKTWMPILREENKLHFNWFSRNTRLFKNEFVYFVYHELNGFEIKKGSEEDLEFIVDSYIKSFPENERKSEEHIRKLIKDGEYQVLVASFQDLDKEDVENVGYAFVRIDYKSKLMFLDYVNVFEEYQSKGLGGVILESLFDKKVHRSAEIEAVIFEIEKAEGKKSKSQEARRRRFYLNHGARDLHVENYAIPTKEGGKLPLDLMILPHYRSTFVASEKIKKFVKECESVIHGDFPHTQDVINSYINNIGEVKHNRGR